MARAVQADQPPEEKRKSDGTNTNTSLACMHMLPFISSPTHNHTRKQIRASERARSHFTSFSVVSVRPTTTTSTMTTRSSSLLLLALALAVQAAPTAGAPAADTVADSCNAIRDFVDYAFCAAALRSSGPGASTADRHAHLLIAADLAAARGTSARDAATAMARDERDPGARDGMEACGILYGATSVPALQFMRGYAAARAWDRARSLLSLTGQAGIGCEAALAGAAAAKGRMAAANREFDQLTTMATALLNRVDHVG
ncbi:hypothetical protein CFC21_076100 [Triticum aestivum]|uniref:Pectinesterase inhibitor domain-containing protein n=4 Tax=Triticinae TaxID=1648030 RepID=A0A3B6MLC0_WHEAT|nr:uncharacterized protein LOC109775190 [Aegilops tauschii subsp. strangulata]XP_044400923.1 uncharacterized protein LOC123124360 [Triticum aestivum]KAF7070593.1 hypothetical protein CFC21_076100 [Triticum aestivum]